ncbi:MAG: hypothetical protein ACKO21_07560 [Nodosilinea sp.]
MSDAVKGGVDQITRQALDVGGNTPSADSAEAQAWFQRWRHWLRHGQARRVRQTLLRGCLKRAVPGIVRR